MHRTVHYGQLPTSSTRKRRFPGPGASTALAPSFTIAMPSASGVPGRARGGLTASSDRTRTTQFVAAKSLLGAFHGIGRRVRNLVVSAESPTARPL
jgi:hypothetical protein